MENQPKKVPIESIKMAVELAKEGMQPPTGTYLNNPEVVAKFIETVARKIDELWDR